MKEVDKNDAPDVSGGYSPEGGCFPRFPGLPPDPVMPFPQPLPSATEDLE